jgi:hypothetical protein
MNATRQKTRLASLPPSCHLVSSLNLKKLLAQSAATLCYCVQIGLCIYPS